MTKLAPEWVRTSDPVIRSPARYHWTMAPASVPRPKTCADYYKSGYYDTNFVMDRTRGGAERLQIMFTVTSSRAVMDLGCGLAYPKMKVMSGSRSYVFPVASRGNLLTGRLRCRRRLSLRWSFLTDR